MAVTLLAVSCSKNDEHAAPVILPAIDITTPAGGFKADNMQLVHIDPTVTNAENATFTWMLGKDTLATTKSLSYAFDSIGVLTLNFTVKTAAGNTSREIPVTISAVTVPYKNAVTQVFEFFPAPGQFTNTLPTWNKGETAEDMAKKALNELTNERMVSLGGFGGFVTMGFDHTILNKPGEYSFIVLGNAFANNGEPGIIQVAQDVNGNGLPDDEWYEIAGSEHNNPKTIKNYQITYYKPDENKTRVPSSDRTISDSAYIRYKDNQGKEGYLLKNIYHNQSYYPQWKGDSITFTGTRLRDDHIVNTSTTPGGQYWILPAFDYGYADNQPNNSDAAKIKLDWAIDKNGKPVKLSGINFIRVYTSIRKEAGWLGEVSTEVAGVRDFNIK
ncbi:cell surface protein [Chitinophaga silvatica]|uniref:Cell surface protein n=2 Tax=Chitinophaga silvatica TaxID=2282649 RepID=A0A3E1YF47_9BACT|nr:cell surface protein [Chitinophaga silvatica]